MWDTSSIGFYYTRFPHKGERPEEDLNSFQQVFYHKLGSSSDEYVVGKEFPRIAEIGLGSSGDTLLISVANGDGGEFEHWLRIDGRWVQITRFEDGIVSATIQKDHLYLLSRNSAPHGQILRMPISQPDLSAASVVIPSGDPVIKEFSVTSDRIYVVDLIGGPQQIRVFDLDGNVKGMVPVKPMSSVGQVLSLSSGDVLYSTQTYTETPAYYRFDPTTGESSRTGLIAPSPIDFTDTEVLSELAVSRDGTNIPLTIVRRKGTELNGENPVLLYGYGGYSISLTPETRYWLRMWIDQGGVYAVGTLRGGGEFGEEWHRGGNLTRKQNVFDDFAACAQWLIDHKYTNPSKFAIMGASNGGLLMGAELTQHPDMFRAVVSRVGIYDMLRVELSPNGSFNVTEFGTVKNPEQFEALYSYSPYHNVKDGTKYPAVLMPTGDRDGRVDPMQSRKMVARLQSSTASGHPVMLRTTAHAGHGVGTSRDEYLSEQTDIFVFLMDQLGMKFHSQVP
jgi:prolyl oligopeptidase